MKFSKPWAFIFLLGLIIHAIAPASDYGLIAPAYASSSATPVERPAGRSGLPSVSQESESIDSFNVHPANRWSDVSSGTFLETLQDGEFSIDGYENTSSSNLRYRDAETTSGDIEVRWRLNASDSDAGGVNGSDFESVLFGLNVTTDEGSGNSSLNAYYYNSTHYVIRPTFTTDDGDNWRSWNIQSDYQDYFQMNGSLGADGIDFIEEASDGIIPTNLDAVYTLGLAELRVNNPVATAVVSIHDKGPIAASTFTNLTLKVRSNVTDFKVRVFDQASNAIGSDQNIVGTVWNTLEWDLSSDADWTGTETGFFLQFREVGGDGTLEVGNGLWIDYVWLTTTDDSSDLTFLEYETYYRAKSKYDLMESTLNWKISDDSDDKLTSTTQGDFKIEEFFDADELIRDINLGNVGNTTYFFGLRSAGANATTWWDFYKADFTEFNWELDTGLFAEVGDSWESESPFTAYTYQDGGIGSSVTTGYELVVPEFDSTSGRLTVFENGSNSYAGALFAIYAVDADDGGRHIVLWLQIEGGDLGGAAPDALHRLFVQVEGAAQASEYVLQDNRSSSVAFSIHHDKQNSKVTLQASFEQSDGSLNTLAYSSDLIGDYSNEFVLLVGYTVVWTTAVVNECHLAMEEWDLVFRDLFNMPLPLPDIDDVLGSAVPNDPISFLLQAFRDLAGLMVESVAAIIANGVLLTTILAALSQMLTELTAILVKLTAIAVDVNTLTGMVVTLTAIAANIVTLTTDVGTIVGNLTTVIGVLANILVDTGLMQSDLVAIASNIADILSDTGDIISVMGDLLDALVDGLGDSWLGQIFSELIALAVDIATEIFDDFISRALAIMTEVYTGLLNYVRSITVAGVSIGDLIDFVDAWMVNFYNVADDLLSLGTQILTVWISVFLMGFLGIILIWAAALAKQDGAVFIEKFAGAMWFNVNPIDFIINIRIPLGTILLGNLFWVVFTSYDWESFLIPAVVIASFQLGATYEIPDISDRWDEFFDYTTGVLEGILDTLLDNLLATAWQVFVTLLSDDILGAPAEVIVFVITAGVAAIILIRGRF